MEILDQEDRNAKSYAVAWWFPSWECSCFHYPPPLRFIFPGASQTNSKKQRPNPRPSSNMMRMTCLGSGGEAGRGAAAQRSAGWRCGQTWLMGGALAPPMTAWGQKMFDANKPSEINSWQSRRVVPALGNDPLGNCDPLGYPRNLGEPLWRWRGHLRDRPDTRQNIPDIRVGARESGKFGRMAESFLTTWIRGGTDGRSVIGRETP